MIDAGLMDASTSHVRHVSAPRQFIYAHFMFAIDLLRLDDYLKFYPLLGINRTALYSLRFQDHYILSRRGLEELFECTKTQFGRIQEDYLRILLFTNLRSFGYVFNPISVYLCYRKDEPQKCDLIYEVGNTFGEQKYYFTQNFTDVQSKEFYVSPFIEHQHNFKFALKIEGSQFDLTVITQTENKQPILTARMRAVHQPLSSRAILLTLLRYPLINFKVIFLIHFQALLLYLKKLRYYKKSELNEYQRNYHQLRS